MESLQQQFQFVQSTFDISIRIEWKFGEWKNL